MAQRTDDLRIEGLRPLLPPAILMEEHAASDYDTAVVVKGRQDVIRILQGEDDRLFVVVGPCSIHEPVAGLDYATRLAKLAGELRDALCIVMRVYFEKPRTIDGWKGLINDPGLDGSFAINRGLRTEFLDPITPQFIADLIAWGAIGARTSESQVHRELASGLSMPVGFKNGTDGTVQIASEAIRSSAVPHHFLSVTKQGVAAIVGTMGNEDTHVILRGGTRGPNYARKSVEEVTAALAAAGLPPRLMVDCSHANSGKDYEVQPEVVKDVASQVARGGREIFGVMLESFLEDGRQEHSQDAGSEGLVYGKSITDACMSWERTLPVQAALAEAVRGGRR